MTPLEEGGSPLVCFVLVVQSSSWSPLYSVLVDHPIVSAKVGVAVV